MPGSYGAGASRAASGPPSSSAGSTWRPSTTTATWGAPARLSAAAATGRWRRSPRSRQGAGHWLPARPAAAAGHYGQAAGGGHARVPPHAPAVIAQEDQEHGQQRGPRGGVRRPRGLVAPQADGERGALDRVGDGHHRVGEQARAERIVPGALEAAGIPGPRRAAADGADARVAGWFGRVHGDPPAQDGPGGRAGSRYGHGAMVGSGTVSDQV